MCMALYLGSDNELPLIEWQEGKTPICVSALSTSEDDSFASERLIKQNKYYIGAWEGCGCGFQFDYADELYDKEDNDRSKESVKSLFEYIRKNVIGAECEILSFWLGDHEKAITHQSNINLNDITLGESFEFLDGQYTIVRK